MNKVISRRNGLICEIAHQRGDNGTIIINEYFYDNTAIDGRRGLDLSWNHLNLPSSICSDEDEDALVNYTYLADGTKVITQQPR